MPNNPFERAVEFPDLEAHESYGRLLGLEPVKTRLEKEAQVLFSPESLDAWCEKHHGCHLPAIELLKRRPPLYIFSGDVGTGKTALASSFGDAVARKLKIPVRMHVLSLKARGSGAVGEMTTLISEAFQYVKSEVQKSGHGSGKPKFATVLLIDEADALAQSRGLAQMHHEDRAGVNALIRGVDEIATTGLPCMIVMCTNRLAAIDSAVQRRAAAVFDFQRPNPEQLAALLGTYLQGIDLSEGDHGRLVKLLGPTKSRSYGYTFSDVTQRYIPTLILAAYPSQKITAAMALDVAAQLAPTPPFIEESN